MRYVKPLLVAAFLLAPAALAGDAAVNPLDPPPAPTAPAVNPLDNPLDPPKPKPAPAAPAGGWSTSPAPAAPPAQAPPQPRPFRLETAPVQGQIFNYELPRNWGQREDSNEIKLWSPDGGGGVGFCGVEGSQTPNGVAFMRQMAAGGNWADFRIHSAVRCQAPRGCEMCEFLVSYTYNRVPFRGWVRTVTMFGAGGWNNQYMLFTWAVPQIWDQVGGELYRVATTIQVANPQLVFQRAHRAVVLNNQNLNRPMDHSSITDGYWQRQKAQGDALARGSDVRRDSYAITTPGGRQYVGQNAIDPSVNGVRDPSTGQVYPLDPHWQGR